MKLGKINDSYFCPVSVKGCLHLCYFLRLCARCAASSVIVGVVYLPLHIVAEGKGHDKCKNGPVCHKLSAFINRVDVCAARIVQTERNKACFNC